MHSIFEAPSVATSSIATSSTPTSSAPAKKLTPRQERAVVALLTTPTQEAAAEAAGISTVTLWRYMKQDEFQAACLEARREAVGQTVTDLKLSTTEAVRTLHSICVNEAAAPTARVNAAKAILDMSFRSRELDGLAARLEALEEAGQEQEIES